jgi:flagellar biosynthetic protein FliR
MTVDAVFIEAFLLVLCRTSAWLVALPLIGGRGIAGFGGLAVAISLAMFLASTIDVTALPSTVPGLIVAALGETAIGLALGWTVGLLLHAFEAAGTFIDLLGGFSGAVLFNPMSGSHGAVFARVNTAIAGVLLFTTPAFAAIVRGFSHSYDQVPIGTLTTLDQNAPLRLASQTTGIIDAGLRIAAPVLGALFILEVGFALASRIVPQAHVEFVGLPVRTLVTLTTFGAALTLFPSAMSYFADRGVEFSQSLLG